jgi:hypothetical protein
VEALRAFLLVACLVATAALSGCGGFEASPTDPTPTPPFPTPVGQTVRLVYAVPSDRAYRGDHAAGITAAFADLQNWYRIQLGGATFTLYASQPETCELPQDADYFRADTWTRVMNGVQNCIPLASYDSPQYRWAIYADVVHECDTPGRIGAAMRGVTIMGRADLDGLSGNFVTGDCGPVQQRPLGRWIGGAGHELGHTFGLPHPAACQQGGMGFCDHNLLMWTGYLTYPDTYFDEDEKARLLESPFIR